MDTKQYWNQRHEDYSKKDWIAKPTIFATQVISFLPDGGRILELGSGQGQDTLYFAQKGFQVVACDFSETALELARKRVPANLRDQVEFMTLDLSEPLQFPTESFDIVYSHLALHYFNAKRTQDLFDEIYTVLKPGGIFVTLTNTHEDPEIAEATKIEDEYYDSVGIQKRYFSEKSMRRFASKFETLLLDAKGETHKDEIKTLIRFVGKKI